VATTTHPSDAESSKPIERGDRKGAEGDNDTEDAASGSDTADDGHASRGAELGKTLLQGEAPRVGKNLKEGDEAKAESTSWFSETLKSTT
jgi:hypothetical protein